MSATQSLDASSPSPDLDQLVQMGLDLARLLNRHVEAVVKRAETHLAADPPEPWPMEPVPHYPADIGMTFSRIARAIRLTKALQARLARERRGSDRREMVRQAVLRSVRRPRPLTDPDGDIIEPPDGVERLDHEAWEHLEDEDTDAEILARPVAEILAIIRRDLGFPPVLPRELWRGRGEVSRSDGGRAFNLPATPRSRDAARQSPPPEPRYNGPDPPPPRR